MAVELSRLYGEMHSEYGVQLITDSCFGKLIRWVHVMENKEFTCSLHGDELVFNSRLNFEPLKEQKAFVDSLAKAQASGLVVAAKEREAFSQEIIDYCNQIEFPLFWAQWDTSYQDIIYKFAKILLAHEQSEMNLSAAFKNAIYFPKDKKTYLRQFERNGFTQEMSYVVVVLEYSMEDEEQEKPERVERMLRHAAHKNVFYEEEDTLVILAVDCSVEELKSVFGAMCIENPDFLVGIGTVAGQFQDIHMSWQNALTACNLAGTAVPDRCISYDELGVYQLLTKIEDEEACVGYIDQVLGELLRYDEENGTEYMDVLECFFENECSMVRTADALYYHKNTMKYKMKRIREVLGYDITSNENRVRIMLAFALRRLENIV